MDVRVIVDGQTQCPQCKRLYTPELGEREFPELCIQHEFPSATPIQREQLLTGLCSDECWDNFLKPVRRKHAGS